MKLSLVIHEEGKKNDIMIHIVIYKCFDLFSMYTTASCYVQFCLLWTCQISTLNINGVSRTGLVFFVKCIYRIIASFLSHTHFPPFTD